MTEKNLRTEDIDQLGQALITLTRELWVLRDRQRVLENLLAEAGIIAPDAVETHQPDAQLTAALAEERERLIQAVLGALTTRL